MLAVSFDGSRVVFVLKKPWNCSASMVAEDMITRSSGLFFWILQEALLSIPIIPTECNSLFNDANQDVSVQASFVRFVHHNDRVLGQERIDHCLAKQHTVCHVLDLGPVARLVVESNQISHFGSNTAVHFLCYSLCHWCCCNSTRLDVCEIRVADISCKSYLSTSNLLSFACPSWFHQILRDFYKVMHE